MRKITTILVEDAFDKFDVDHSGIFLLSFYDFYLHIYHKSNFDWGLAFALYEGSLSFEQFTEWATKRRFVADAVFEAPTTRVTPAMDIEHDSDDNKYVLFILKFV